VQPRHGRKIVNRSLTEGLNPPHRVCFNSSMSSTVVIEIRRAKAADAQAIAATHDAAWRTSYQGIIPGPELEKLINRRGPLWWENAIAKGSRVALLSFGDRIAGYANYGRNRARSLFYDGEIYELYLCPEFQGLGFGRRLFTAARRDPRAERTEEPGRVGAQRQRPRGRVLSRARWPRGRALVGAIRRQEPRQGRVRLAGLRFLSSAHDLFRKPVPTFRDHALLYTAGFGRPAIAQAARTVFTSRHAIVIGPTPPGTGVTAPATSAASL